MHVITEAVGQPLDDLDSVVNVLEDASVQGVTTVRRKR